MTDDDYPLDNLQKYRNYTDDKLLREFDYLLPSTLSSPYEIADKMQDDYDGHDFAHFVAVVVAMAERIDAS